MEISQEKMQAYLKDVDALNEKHGLRLGAELQATAQGIIPRLAVYENSPEPKTDEQPAKGNKEAKE